jgi:hypothetical protein
MDSLAGGVSCLSISESPALALIPQVCDVDNKGHQALDKSILEALGLYIELNWEPNRAFLLSNIINNDARLSTLSVEGASLLLSLLNPLVKIVYHTFQTMHISKWFEPWNIMIPCLF